MNTDLMNLLKIVAAVAGVLIGGSVAFAAIKVAFAAGKTVTSMESIRAEVERLRESVESTGRSLVAFADEVRRDLAELDKEVTRVKYGRRVSDRGTGGEGNMAASPPADSGGGNSGGGAS